MTERLTVYYHIRCDADQIEARAASIAVEQSVEMPLDAITDFDVLSKTVGRVEHVRDLGGGRFEAAIGLAVATTGLEAGQLINMLFGNSSIHDDVTLADVDFPPSVLAAFPGPGPGMAGLKGTHSKRALTGSALKPQGLPPDRLAYIGQSLAAGGVDFIKDDHGLANQAYAPFAARIAACARAIKGANPDTRYIPSVTGNLDQMREQIRIARDNGLDCIMIAPMIAGLPSLEAIRRENSDIAIFAHPALAGAARIAPPLLLGKLFRLLGADATIFPNYGGRFGYSPQTCQTLSDAARLPWQDIAPSLPIPAGGMSAERVDEMLEFYGPDVMLLIGGGLLAAKERMTQETRRFTQQVVDYKSYPERRNRDR